jgi:hypothetical protein
MGNVSACYNKKTKEMEIKHPFLIVQNKNMQKTHAMHVTRIQL